MGLPLMPMFMSGTLGLLTVLAVPSILEPTMITSAVDGVGMPPGAAASAKLVNGGYNTPTYSASTAQKTATRYSTSANYAEASPNAPSYTNSLAKWWRNSQDKLRQAKVSPGTTVTPSQIPNWNSGAPASPNWSDNTGYATTANTTSATQKTYAEPVYVNPENFDPQYSDTAYGDSRYIDPRYANSAIVWENGELADPLADVADRSYAANRADVYSNTNGYTWDQNRNYDRRGVIANNTPLQDSDYAQGSPVPVLPAATGSGQQFVIALETSGGAKEAQRLALEVERAGFRVQKQLHRMEDGTIRITVGNELSKVRSDIEFARLAKASQFFKISSPVRIFQM